MSIISQARQKVSAQNEERKKSVKEIIAEANKTRLEINERFLGQVFDSPFTFELLCEYYNLIPNWDKIDYKDVANKLIDLSRGTDYYEENLGDISFPLMQKSVPAKDSGKDGHWVDNYAWAVKFVNVYGIDICFVPYSERERGFAITVLDPRDNKHFFPRDIPHNMAVDWVTEYLLKNQ